MSNTVAQLVRIDQDETQAPSDPISLMQLRAPQQCRGLQQDLQVCKIVQHDFATGNHTDLRLGHLESEPDGHEEVVLKEVRGSSVEKRPKLKGQITEGLRQYILAAKGLDHPNVGSVYGLSDGHGPVPHLVLPHFSNGDIAKDILSALVYLHDKGVAHGGVHGGNVLIDGNGAAVLIAQLWTLRRPFYSMCNEYELLVTLRKLKLGQLAQLDRPEEVPAPVWALLQDCLSVEPHARPNAKKLLAGFDLSLKMR